MTEAGLSRPEQARVQDAADEAFRVLTGQEDYPKPASRRVADAPRLALDKYIADHGYTDNEEIFDRIMQDASFRDVASTHLMREVYERLRNRANVREKAEGTT